jgi:hypothetical protein
MRLSITDLLHQLVGSLITKDDVCVDATAGNGLDTVFLAEQAKFVYSFDTQDLAITSTKALLQENNLENYSIIKESHLLINEFVTDYKGVMFNLGYLPKVVSKSVNKTEIYLQSITNILNKLKIGGFITITCYPNSEEGKIESEEINKLVSALDARSYNVFKLSLPNFTNSPYALLVVRILIQ